MIESYSFGQIVVNGEEYRQDLIIYPDRVDSSWWRKAGHSLCEDDLEEAMAEEPEVLVVGTGAQGLMEVPQSIRDYLATAGIELIAASTKEACEKFNQLCGRREVVAALHLTC